jgi:hypothetical protein
MMSMAAIASSGLRFSLKVAVSGSWVLEGAAASAAQKSRCKTFKCKDGLFFERLKAALGPKKAVVVHEALLFHQ